MSALWMLGLKLCMTGVILFCGSCITFSAWRMYNPKIYRPVFAFTGAMAFGGLLLFLWTAKP